MVKYILVFLFTTSFLAKAQYDFNADKFIEGLVGDVNSDRPGKAISAQTCGFITLQLQTGFNYGDFGTTNPTESRFLIPTQLKLGLSQKLEVNFGFEYQNAQSTFTSPDTAYTWKGLTNKSLNLRYAFMQGYRWRPFIAVEAGVLFKTSKGDFQQSLTGYSILLSTSNKFGYFSFNTNFGFINRGNDPLSSFVSARFPFVINLGYQVGNRLNFFAETFGNFDYTELGFDGGVAIKLNNDIYFDIAGGYTDQIFGEPQWFAEAGISMRYSFLKYFAKKKAGQFFQGN